MTFTHRLFLLAGLQLAIATPAHSQRGAAPPADTLAASKVPKASPPFFDFQVDKPVRSMPTNRPPEYPRDLRVTNTQGKVLARFVVDTTGQAEMGTFEVVRTDNALFTEAVKNALPDYRFVPAELRGRKVRQLVTMPFVFSISP